MHRYFCNLFKQDLRFRFHNVVCPMKWRQIRFTVSIFPREWLFMTNFKSHVDKDNNLMAIAIIKELSLYKMNLQKSIRREIINCDNKALLKVYWWFITVTWWDRRKGISFTTSNRRECWDRRDFLIWLTDFNFCIFHSTADAEISLSCNLNWILLIESAKHSYFTFQFLCARVLKHPP